MNKVGPEDLLLARMFREYWIYKEGWAEDPSLTVAKLNAGKDDGTRIEYENEVYLVFFKDTLEFAVL